MLYGEHRNFLRETGKLMEELLYEYFHKGKDPNRLNYLPLEKLDEYFESFSVKFSEANKERIYLRCLKKKINRSIICACINDLSKEKREFVILHYKKGYDYTYIADKIHVDKNQLLNWRKSILKEIETMFFFNFSEEDVFCANKIITMIYVLTELLEFFETCNQLKFSTKLVDQYKSKRNAFLCIYKMLQDCLESDNKMTNKTDKTLYLKALNHNFTNAEISSKVGYSLGNTSAILKKYRQSAIALLC